jgi:hypothetical protein
LRWLWVVRILTLLSLLVSLVSLGIGDPVVVVFVAPLYLAILVGLVPKKWQKTALAWAVGMGTIGFVISLVGVGAVLGGGFRDLSLWGKVLAIVVALGLTPQAALVGSAIKAYYALGREAGDTKQLARAVLGPAVFVVIIVLLLVLATMNPPTRSRDVVNQASAVGSLRTINTAEITYAETYKTGYSPSLGALGPPTGGSTESASAAGLFDSVLAGGLKSGYKFTYTPGPPDKAGHVKTYTVVARPVEYGKSGKISFFTDESGIIRMTEEDRPATAKDPPLGG